MSPRSAITTARGAPTASIAWVAPSATTGQVPDSARASGTATRISSHAASVLRIAACSLAATSAALVSGRVATSVTPEASPPP